MIEDEPVVKVKKVIKEPQISLTMISRYIVATEKGKVRILKGCKYPPEYIPRFYEMARKLVCEVFTRNYLDQHELYFQSFQEQAAIYRKEAKAFPEKKDGYKNRIFSAKGLDAIVAMSPLLLPILQRYVLNNNLTQRKDAIRRNDVRIGAMADLLVSDQTGINQIGFLKFNFSTKKLKKEEAAAKLYVLKTFFEKRGLDLDRRSCILVDVMAWRIYILSDAGNAEPAVNQATLEIRNNWNLI